MTGQQTKTSSNYFNQNRDEWHSFLEAIAEGNLEHAKKIGDQAGLTDKESVKFGMDNAILARLSLQVGSGAMGW